MRDNGVSRRHFFFGSLLAGAVPAAGYGSVPSLRALGYKAFYDKLNVASVGCGGQGGQQAILFDSYVLHLYSRKCGNARRILSRTYR